MKHVTLFKVETTQHVRIIANHRIIKRTKLARTTSALGPLSAVGSRVRHEATMPYSLHVTEHHGDNIVLLQPTQLSPRNLHERHLLEL